MQPRELTAGSFVHYPPEARGVAMGQLGLLRELPLVLVVILLRELMGYDWRFPAERVELDKQMKWLGGLSGAERGKALQGFVLPLEAGLTGIDWVGNPSGFMESFTAWLWSTHRLDGFRATAEAYTAKVNSSFPEVRPAMPRLGVVVVGAGTERAGMPLFRKLRPHGVHLTGIVTEGGMDALVREASRRAKGAGTGFRHWYIDGGTAGVAEALTQVSYGSLEEPRAKLLSRIQGAVAKGTIGPEELRSVLARLQPGEIGLAGGDPVLDRFQMSLLTEGAGAQIFATTFVQWSARECVRRAQPETLLVRYAPRQKAQTMDAMLRGAPVSGTDAAGSLVDADMGAFYTWINLRRLSGAEDLRFLAWYEDHGEAVAIGPGLPQGTVSDSRVTIKQVLAMLA